jgi:hypothetical protein
MKNARTHPIGAFALALLETDASGAVVLREAAAHQLANVLLAELDEALDEAVRALTVVGALAMNELAMPNAAAIGDRILSIAELAIERLKRIDRRKANARAQLRASTAARIGGAPPGSAPRLGARPPKGSIALSTLMPRRPLR